MEIITTSIIIFLALILIVLGYILTKADKNLRFLTIAGGTLFLILGLLMFSNPIEYKTGEDITELLIYGDNYTEEHWSHDSPTPNCTPNNLDCVKLFHTNETTTYLFTELDSQTNNLLAIILLLIGLINIIIISIKMYDDRYDEREEPLSFEK